MGNVAGPYSEFDWILMKALKADIKWYTRRNPEVYRETIAHERGMLKDLLRRES